MQHLTQSLDDCDNQTTEADRAEGRGERAEQRAAHRRRALRLEPPAGQGARDGHLYHGLDYLDAPVEAHRQKEIAEREQGRAVLIVIVISISGVVVGVKVVIVHAVAQQASVVTILSVRDLRSVNNTHQGHHPEEHPQHLHKQGREGRGDQAGVVGLDGSAGRGENRRSKGNLRPHRE